MYKHKCRRCNNVFDDCECNFNIKPKKPEGFIGEYMDIPVVIDNSLNGSTIHVGESRQGVESMVVSPQTWNKLTTNAEHGVTSTTQSIITPEMLRELHTMWRFR